MNINETIEDNETIEKSIKIIKKSMKTIETFDFSRGGQVWGTSPPLEKQCFFKGGEACPPPKESIAFPGGELPDDNPHTKRAMSLAKSAHFT